MSITPAKLLESDLAGVHKLCATDFVPPFDHVENIREKAFPWIERFEHPAARLVVLYLEVGCCERSTMY